MSDFSDEVDEWVAMGNNGQVRTLRPDELFDRATAQLPRDHPLTERESAVKQAAMAEHGVSRLTRANAAWADRMARNQTSVVAAKPVLPSRG